MFDYKIHVLRTDNGSEYRNVDLLCQRIGVARQIGDVRNQASSGKAEHMHRTILNMARSMIFFSRLPIKYRETRRVRYLHPEEESGSSEHETRIED